MSFSVKFQPVVWSLSSWRYWAGRLLPVTELTPVRIALGYAILGMGALFASDVLFVRYLSEPLLSQAQALKGAVEVVLTAGFIFAVTDRRETQLQRRKTRLDSQREQLQVLHRVLRHNLRNDLNVIQGNVALIRRQLPEDRFSDECTTVLNTAEKMMHYTEQAASIRRITDSNGRTRTHDLTEIIPRLVDTHPEVTDETRISTAVPDQATVEANPMFREALREVLANALKHNDAETPTVRIDVEPGAGPPHMVEIRVADNGPGIPPSELEPLQAGEEGQLLHLSGMGLWFVEWTVRYSGGQLRFADNEWGGTTVIVRVPKAPEMVSSLFPLWGE